MLPLNAAYILGHVAFLTGGSKASESHGLACHDASLRTSVRAVHFEGVCSASPKRFVSSTQRGKFGEESLSAGDYLPESADGFHCRAVWLQIWRVLERHDLVGTLQNVCPPGCPSWSPGGLEWEPCGSQVISGDRREPGLLGKEGQYGSSHSRGS